LCCASQTASHSAGSAGCCVRRPSLPLIRRSPPFVTGLGHTGFHRDGTPTNGRS
jgi:hypothetical protein